MSLESIAKNLYSRIKREFPKITCTDSLKKFGDDILEDACKKDVFVIYPFTVSPDNIINHYTGENKDITDSSIIKIDFGIGNTRNESCFIGKTLCKTQNKIVDFLDDLEKLVKERVNKGKFKTNDDMAIYIQKKCIKNNCSPIENCKSYQFVDRMLFSDTAKYIMLNYTKYYDDDDMVIMYNDCFDLEDGETYTVNITVYEDDDNSPELKYNTNENTDLVFFNDQTYLLKLKSSRKFYSMAKTKHGRNVFHLSKYNSASERLGRNECINKMILEQLSSDYCNRPVYSVKFTVNIKN